MINATAPDSDSIAAASPTPFTPVLGEPVFLTVVCSTAEASAFSGISTIKPEPMLPFQNPQL